MMSDKQYKVARKGVVEQLKLAQRLHCKHMEQKYKEALEKLEKRFLKPDAVGCFDLGARYQIVIIIFKWLRVWKRKNILLSNLFNILKISYILSLIKLLV